MKVPEDAEEELRVESAASGGCATLSGTESRSRSSCSATHETSQAHSEASSSSLLCV